MLLDDESLFLNDSAFGLKFMVKRMEKKPNIFPNSLMSLFFLFVTDAEEANGAKKWWYQ